jgi:hypothetical protein
MNHKQDLFYVEISYFFSDCLDGSSYFGRYSFSQCEKNGTSNKVCGVRYFTAEQRSASRGLEGVEADF